MLKIHFQGLRIDEVVRGCDEVGKGDEVNNGVSMQE
jgi:hypothetical protein